MQNVPESITNLRGRLSAIFIFWLSNVSKYKITFNTIYAQIMDSDWAAFVEDNDNNRGQKYPL